MTAGRHVAHGIDLRVSVRQGAGLLTKPVSCLLLAVTAVVMVGTAVATIGLHMGISPVLTGSMRGTFDPGAVVITRPVPVAAVSVGDVLAFQPPGHAETYVHRVRTVSGDPSRPVITTKGDANPAVDPWKAQLTDPVAHEVVFSAPHVGRLLVLVQSGSLRPLLLALAGLVFTVMGVRALLGTAPSPRSTPSYAG